MTLLAVERIKLFSTRSPWWCAIATLVLTVGFTAMMASQASLMSVRSSQLSHQFGLMVVMVMAALAVTTEYRFGTIRATFQAIPNRTAALLAKTGVVAIAGLVLGEIAAFGSLGIAAVLSPQSDLALSGAEAWRQVAGVGPVFMLSAVLAVAVGILLRHTAGTVTLLLIWSLLVEQMISLIPTIGQDLYQWMPFTVVENFLAGSGAVTGRSLSDMPLGPWASLGYFAVVAVGLLVVALVVANRRDA